MNKFSQDIFSHAQSSLDINTLDFLLSLYIY